jgi:hypothetical protein
MGLDADEQFPFETASRSITVSTISFTLDEDERVTFMGFDVRGPGVRANGSTAPRLVISGVSFDSLPESIQEEIRKHARNV